MYRRGNKSKIITSLVLVAVLTISIGYAAFTNTLRITPQATITPDSATFDIDFSKVSTSVDASDITPTLTGTGITAEDAEIDNSTSPTITNLSVNFTEPGQKAVYSFYAYNNGEYLAYLNSINFINPEGKDAFITCVATDSTTQYVSDACKGIKVSIKIVPTDSSIETITTDVTKENIQGHSLAKKTAEEVIVTIEYASGSAVADGAFNVDIGDITLVYTTLDGTSSGSDVVTQPSKACTFDGELVQGAEFIDGQYTYRYMQHANGTPSEYGGPWGNIEADGWGVILTDVSSTDPITTELCTTINDKPIVSMQYMFFDMDNGGSRATSIDLSSFDTSNVISMMGMFMSTTCTSLDLSSFDTTNVTDMSHMFNNSAATTLDLSGFNTTNVTNMGGMFTGSYATTLNLSSFNTTNVTNMSAMFNVARATTLDLSSFDTTNVMDMTNMFGSALATTGYAKTQTDADKFNDADVTSIPDTLTFQVK